MHRWNLSVWMDALGFKRRDQPEVIHAVQPVVILGDQSALTAPILTPAAWFGGNRTGVAAEYTYIQLTSKAPGGTYLRQIYLGVVTAGTAAFRLTDAPIALGNLNAMNRIDMMPDPTVSTFLMGTSASIPTGTSAWPFLDTTTAADTVIIDGIYIRPGWTFELWNRTVNIGMNGAFQFEDLPAQQSGA